MLAAFQIASIVLVAIVLAPSLAHALEFPGKMRLEEADYLKVQPIYYPGFTIAGAAEPASLIALLLLAFTGPGGAAFWLTLGAFLALLATHLVYWLATHPVNNFWLADFKLKGAGAGFFGFDPFGRGGTGDAKPDWTVLRDRWEYSHIVRAALALVGLVLIVSAVAL